MIAALVLSLSLGQAAGTRIACSEYCRNVHDWCIKKCKEPKNGGSTPSKLASCDGQCSQLFEGCVPACEKKKKEKEEERRKEEAPK